MLRNYGYGNGSPALIPGASQDFTLVARIFLCNNFNFGETFAIHFNSQGESTHRIFFRFNFNGTVACVNIITTTTQHNIGATAAAVGTYPRGKWYTLAVKRTGTTWQFFIDGTQVGSSVTQSGTWDPSSLTDKYFRISPRNFTTGSQFAIKYATMHFRGLSDAEILALGTSMSPTISTTNLMGHWIFSVTTGFNIPDLSLNGYTLAPITYPVAAGSAPVTPTINTADYWTNISDQAISFWEGIHPVLSTSSPTLPYTATFTIPNDCFLRRLGIIASVSNSGAASGGSFAAWKSTAATFNMGQWRVNGGFLTSVTSDHTTLQNYVSIRIDRQLFAGDVLEWILPVGFQSDGTTPFLISYGMGLGAILTA
jgi:hypothetical protein